MSAPWLSKTFKYVPDLDAYFARIKYSGSRDLTAETLKSIQWHHVQAIPFENIDIALSIGIDLTPEVVENKLVHSHRGGYCYEHNTLMLYVLRTMGYDVTPILARSRWGKPADIVSPATHLVIKVNIGGILWLFDAGFSNYGSPLSLEIETDREQVSALETRRIVKTDAFYIHQLKFNDGIWQDVFVFTLDESYPFDWFVGSYYVSTYPESGFVVNIIVSKPTPTSRILLMNKVLKITYLDGSSVTRDINTQEEYLSVLSEYFDLTFPEGTVLHPRNMPW